MPDDETFDIKQKKIAVALEYNEDLNEAPHVVATGKGPVAEKIVSAAKENKVPIKENPALAQALGKLSLGQEIPEELYQAVAEVLAFIAHLDKNYK